MGFKIQKSRVSAIGRHYGGSRYGVFMCTDDIFNRGKLTGFTKLVSIPSGTRPPHSFLMAQQSGGLAVRINSNLNIENFNMAGGLNLEVSGNLFIQVLSAQLDRIINLVISEQLSIVKLDASLSAAANIFMSSQSQIQSNVDIGAIIDVILNGVINISDNANLTALAHISADIGGATPLSPEGLARAVWSSFLSDYQDDGTFGKALADALANVGGGDPQAIADEIMSRGLLKVSDFIALK